jgi:hypothetical protein
MKVISSAELRNNMKKYLLARQDDLPEDFFRGITKDELMKGIEQDLRKIYHK